MLGLGASDKRRLQGKTIQTLTSGSTSADTTLTLELGPPYGLVEKL